MKKITIYDFREDILEAALKHLQDNTMLVFPTSRAANLCARKYQACGELLQAEFVAIEELKAMMLAGETPLLQDEKRLLALFQVLEPEDKAIFHLEEYQDLVAWGANFLAFFSELCEENVPSRSFRSLKQEEIFMRKAGSSNLSIESWLSDCVTRLLWKLWASLTASLPTLLKP